MNWKTLLNTPLIISVALENSRASNHHHYDEDDDDDYDSNSTLVKSNQGEVRQDTACRDETVRSGWVKDEDEEGEAWECMMNEYYEEKDP
ncbi:hypothetical protein E2C01_072429 [Portunus trituberculatus]|uniref:Uncharacterized protein n=1 Tax=Portunus trituberculatus TaxID=210409 RepID=A0A5B7I7T3_PORTR|nr:hypothetical protein [Portunus trituberculatus]